MIYTIENIHVALERLQREVFAKDKGLTDAIDPDQTATFNNTVSKLTEIGTLVENPKPTLAQLTRASRMLDVLLSELKTVMPDLQQVLSQIENELAKPSSTALLVGSGSGFAVPPERITEEGDNTSVDSEPDREQRYRVCAT